MTLTIDKVKELKEKPNPKQLGFGKYFTDHMFMMDYEREKGWFNPRIKPYEPLSLDPATMVFHYSQSVFEGLKAYRTEDDRVLLFRPEKNFERLNESNRRLSIPLVDNELILQYLKKLIEIEKEWIPKEEGTSLYIRPFIIPTDTNLRVAPANTYKLMIILSPVGSYYPEGIHPVSIYVEHEYTRAVKGGTGTAKTAGNYSAGYVAQEKAAQNGFAQVLWLDGMEKKYIEEVGSMNVFFRIDDEVVTPKLNGSILPGITRMSIIELLKSWGVPVKERLVSMEEIIEAYKNNRLKEAFGTGTAAVISPIGELNWHNEQYIINNKKTGELSKKLYETITSIQTGSMKDTFNWTEVVK
ncbi:branched-chain amino acid aminotransferase [Evansella cellulosilytica]|uniref:Branched-chain-amino-acid aminotransferase n=1 Tax=Evansella cellulosilytica (strain ATCC 21833 / DSM 2522 / FERM P-1141 / JCM 9156 / N-4) TaxID=649639 RepID=E6U0V8_EVAC2|nr:branched-chain amino acid aminotransferase [Evansella cellulosilytica]ADU30270.1 branched-chain amino acid aminotransferase [Evansella cellulosilytica DSM 2522]